MKVGVTGATGFLGRYLVDQFIAAGHDVVTWSRTRPSRLASPRWSWIRGDLNDASTGEALAEACDVIVHAAVMRSGQSFVSDPKDPIAYFQTNVVGSLRLIEAAARRGRRFVFVSSGAVHDRVLADRNLDETHPLWPSTLYGSSKASIETLIHAYGYSGKLDACTLRPTAIYGVADPADHSKWWQLLRQVLDGKTVAATGGGKVVHAVDVARAAVILANTDQAIAGETFNCTDRLISHHEVARIAKRIAADHPLAQHAIIQGPEKVSTRPMDTSKIERLGMSFGGTDLLEETIAELMSRMVSEQESSQSPDR